MKFILSRKGFDSGAGGCASPIIGDRLISLPIPEKCLGEREKPTYNDLSFEYDGNEYSYRTLLENLKKYLRNGTDFNGVCHLDPDINEKAWKIKPDGWAPAFGPHMRTFGKHLRNKNVKKDDIFLFFGWFRKVEKKCGQFCYADAPDIHTIYGYLQIGNILQKDEDRDKSSYWWHPHSNISGDYIITPRENLKIGDDEIPSCPGYGLFKFSESVTLTDTEKQGNDCKRSFWKKDSIFKPDGFKNYKRGNDEYFYKKGQWQEYIYDESTSTDRILKWFKEVLKENSYLF